MSDAQRSALRAELAGATELHHGDCVGADVEADSIARELELDVVVHPPSDSRLRAFCARPGDVVWQPAPYLERNRDIVDSTDRLVAAPRSDEEELRSGTWATVRYARKVGRPATVLARS